MKHDINVFEILKKENKQQVTKGQEQDYVPDLSFSGAIKDLERRQKQEREKQLQQQRQKKLEEQRRQQLLQPEQAPAPAPKAEPEPKKKSLAKRALEYIIPAILVACILLVFGFPQVQGDSMEPALSDGDRAVVWKPAREYKPGDVIVFKTDGDKRLVKRIVACEDDSVIILREGGLYINNSLVEEDYIYDETHISDYTVTYPVIVKEDSYFVLGDNRDDSRDSRTSDVGQVHKDDIVGKVIFVWHKM